MAVVCNLEASVSYRERQLLGSPQANCIDPPCKPLVQTTLLSGPPIPDKGNQTGFSSLCRLGSICKEAESLQSAYKIPALCPLVFPDAALGWDNSAPQHPLEVKGDLTLSSPAGFFLLQLPFLSCWPSLMLTRGIMRESCLSTAEPTLQTAP